MKFYLTTPIYYINDKPHIGHAYSTIAADALARYHRLKGDEVFFSVGVDENAQKTVDAAKNAEKDVASYTTDMSALWESTWKQADITYSTFIRTTSPEHTKAVIDIISRVQKKGDIYKGMYEGYYCVGCEAFKKEDDLADGFCPDHKKKPEWLKEENYFFALHKYQEQLLLHIEKHPEFVQPETRRNEIVAFIKRGLQDFSVSRSTQKWGIPWPGDKEQVVYVWFDALVNYLTAAGFPEKGYEKTWPADLHIVGKDIIKFHCIYWPAMLLSAGLPLPKTVFAHGFFTINGEKISKSLGNAISPVELAKTYGLDAVRYFLLREIPFGSDGDFSLSRLQERYTADLAKGLGNFVARVAALASKIDSFEGVEECEEEKEAQKITEETWSAWEKGFEEYHFEESLEVTWRLISYGDRLIEQTKPWELLKNNPERARAVLCVLSEIARHVGLLVSPLVPSASRSIAAQFVFRISPKAEYDILKSWKPFALEKVEKGGVLFPL